MKIKSLFFCMLLAGVLTSCLEGSANYTPVIRFSSSLFITSGGDSLSLHYGDEGALCLDTLAVGDTLVLPIIFEAYANNLVSTKVEYDTAALNAWAVYSADFAQILDQATDSASLSYYYKNGYGAVSMPLYLVALKSGSSTMKMYITSDSKYSSNSLELKVVAN